MAISQITYSSTANITITVGGLASASARQSAFIDNSSNRYLDAEVYLALQLVAGTPSLDRAIYVWFYGSADGTNYTDNASGSDATITLRTPTNLRGPFIISTPDAGGLVYKAVIGSVASFFGGILPVRWGIVIENRTGLAFNATEGNHTKQYRGITLTSI